MKSVYLDHAATTPPDPEILDAMYPYLREHFGNAHSPHQFGRKANGAVESSRNTVAEALDCDPSEIVFTSGGTESNNAIIKGVAQATDRSEIITSKAEHHAVLNAVEHCKHFGMKPVYLEPQSDGSVTPEQIEKAISNNTALVTLMHVNNELGTINPIQEIGNLCRKHQIPFHTDAVQSVGKISVNVNELDVDFLSASGHKIHAPKGVGFMYVRNQSPWSAWMHGGSQEANRRAGTLNVPGIVGLAKAVQKSVEQQQQHRKHLQELRNIFVNGLEDMLGNQFQINGPRSNGTKVPHILNVSFLDHEGNPADGEMVLMNLDMEGVCASSGSACASGAVEPSHVLQSIGLNRDEAQSAIRFSMGKNNTKQDIRFTLKKVEEVLKRIL